MTKWLQIAGWFCFVLTLAVSAGSAVSGEDRRPLELAGLTTVGSTSLITPSLAAPDLALRAEALCQSGDRAFRRADFAEARKEYAAALSANPKSARAFWGLGRIERLHSRWASARAAFVRAYTLDPNDPDIVHTYAETLAGAPAEAVLLRRYLTVSAQHPRGQREAALGRLQFRERIGERPLNFLASVYRPYRLPLRPYYGPSGLPAGLLLRMRVNDRQEVLLLVDTGAKGLLLAPSIVAKLGLERIGAARLGGFGIGSAQDGYTALASSIQAGDLRLENCPVEVSDVPLSRPADGVIGIRLFSEFLIRLDTGRRTLELLPFTEPQPAATPVLQSGHLLLVKTAYAPAKSGYFLLDTGAAVNAIAARALDKPARGEKPSERELRGFSGNVPVAQLPRQEWQVGRERLMAGSLAAVDLDAVSESEGMEISGLIGFPALQQRVLTINYRDGLICLALAHAADGCAQAGSPVP